MQYALVMCPCACLNAVKVEHWLHFAQHQIYANADFGAVNAAADELDDRMILRSYLVGYRPSAADFAIWGAIKGPCLL